MKGKVYIYKFIALASLLFVCQSCTEKFQSEDMTAAEKGLVLQLGVNDESAVSVSSRGSNNVDMRETYIETVDVFFLENGKDDILKYFSKVKVDQNGTAILDKGTWKYDTGLTYDVYVIANKNDYDNPITDEVENDLNWIENRTQLLALTDTDPNIAKAEGEQYDQSTSFSGKTFLMDGKASWKPVSNMNSETISVDLAHAAAKLKVNVEYDKSLWSDKQIVSVTKKLVHYVQDAKALAEGGNIALVEPQGESSTSGFSLANYTSNENGTRSDVLYAYSYPNDWGIDIAECETYFLMNIQYNYDNKIHQSYYKVPVRISGNTNDLKLERNTEYTINVNVDRLGNENIDKPLSLTPTFSIAKWEPETVNVEDSEMKYLVVSDKEIEMHNVADTTVTFFSSSPIGINVSSVYYVDKNGNAVSENNNLVNVKYDNSTLTGEIKISSEIPKIVTARYIKLTVTNRESVTEIITIVQYPSEYISGVPGLYSYADGYKGNWPSGIDQSYYTDEIKQGLNGHIGNKVDMKSKYYLATVNGGKGAVYRIDLSYKAEDGNPQYIRDNGDVKNNRMYLVQISSTNKNYTVARPNISNGTTASGEENNRLVSPAFMLASNLGNISDVSWTEAQTNCLKYVETTDYKVDISDRLSGNEYDVNGHRIFNDWRLPTYAELVIIAAYQYNQSEVMDGVLTDNYYWAADNNTYIDKNSINSSDIGSLIKGTIPEGSPDGGVKIRCIRDVTPEDLKEFKSHLK